MTFLPRRLPGPASIGAACAALVLVAGCGDADQIRRYKAPKPDLTAALLTDSAATPAHGPLQAAEPQRMLAAIVPHAGQAWYFKVVGTPESLEAHAAPFKQLLKSLRFEQGEPRWQLPDGWRQQPAAGMRYATFLLGSDDDALQLSVIPLPVPEGDPLQNTLANVNRWREQLGLPPVTAQQLSESTETIELDGATATMVDLVSAAQAAGADTAAASPAPRAPTAAATGTGLDFTVPDGWKATPLVVSRGGITLRHDAAFEVNRDGKRVEFTLDRMSASVGLLQNVNRWRTQIGLEPMSAKQLNEATSTLEIDGVAASMVELVGKQETILGIVAVENDQAWYFKLRGDKDLAEREKDNFRAFAGSVAFP